jgi:hypothetical protein
MKFIFFLITTLYFISNNSYCQWSNNPNENLLITENGVNFYTVPNGEGGLAIIFNDLDIYKGYLQLIDKYGYIKWVQPKIILGGPGVKSYFKNIFQSFDGTYIIGFTSGNTYIDPIPRYEYDPYVQKTDTSGNKLWGENGIRLRADSTGKEISGIDFCYDGDGGLFAFWNFHYEINYPPYYYDSLFIQQISKEGERLWGENGIFIDDSIFSALDLWIVIDDNNGIYIQYRKRNTEYYIKKFDSSGSLNWTLSVPLNYSRAIKDSSGGIIISGVMDSYPTRKLVINRISSEGEKLWGDGIIVDDSVNNNLHESADLLLNSDNTISVFWDTQWFLNNEVFLQRFTLDGQALWQSNLNIGNLNKRGIVESDNFSNIIFWYQSNGMYAQKIDAAGNSLWSEDKLVSNLIAIANFIPTENHGAIIIGGSQPLTIYAQQISKYGNLGEVITSVKEDENNIKPNDFYLAQNYPNPFNPTTRIDFVIKENGLTSLKVYDLLGREVATLVNENLQAGTYYAEFNGSNLPSGIYFYQLQAGNFVQTRKMILLK